MKGLESLRGIDVYLIDQLLKGRINTGSKILDAGCGSGRNIHYLIENGINVTGVDANSEAISFLRKQYPQIKDQFTHSTLEKFSSTLRFDFIICNAVLHFANSHDQFDNMFTSLVKHLNPNGILFIRMTSDIGLSLKEGSKTGVFDLPDGSLRYLITRKKVDELILKHPLTLLEPVKTVKVEELRSMITLVFEKII